MKKRDPDQSVPFITLEDQDGDRVARSARVNEARAKPSKKQPFDRTELDAQFIAVVEKAVGPTGVTQIAYDAIQTALDNIFGLDHATIKEPDEDEKEKVKPPKKGK